MNSKFVSARSHFNDLLIGMEHDHGTRDTCVHFLLCLKDALRHTTFRNAEDARHQFETFYDIFTHMKPRMAIIQNYLDDILEHMSELHETDLEQTIGSIIAQIEESEADNEERNMRLKKEAVRNIQNNSRILVHNHSHTVLDVLDMASKTHKHFDVIVAEQEASRTLDVVKFLQEHGIPFVVVPEYMLSCLEVDISCMLIGAVTLKNDMHFVVDAGTKAVASEMKLANIPVYLMLTTNKFSYWKTKPALQTQKTVKSIAHPHADFSFDRIKFSHDRLPLSLVDKVITEEGIYTPDQLKEDYAKKFQEYQDMHRQIAGRLEGRKKKA